MKLSEQKRRGIKNIKAPSELDWQVHNLLAGRKPDGRSRVKRCSQPPAGAQQPKATTIPMASNTTQKQWPQRGKVEVGKVEDLSDVDANEIDHDSESDLVDLLTPQQYHSSMQNGFHDAFEPMTIIEEFGRNQSTAQHDLTMDDDDVADDEYSFNRHVTSSANLNSDASDSADIKQLQRELLLHDIQLKLIQRQNEDERMGNERELFRKQSILLDLQTKRAELELHQLQQPIEFRTQ